MDICITGSTSGIGHAIKKKLCNNYNVVEITRSTLDLSNVHAVHKYKTINFTDSFHQVYRDKLYLKTRSFKEIINDPVWNKLHSTFNRDDKAWVECEQKCHCKLVDKEYAVGWETN